MFAIPATRLALGIVLALACLFAPPAVAQSAPQQEGTQPADEERFDVLEFQIDGNTVLPALTIEKAVYSHLGERRVVKDVEAARDALEKAYHAAGFPTVLVDIPEQKIETGVVRLKVTEGSIERLRVSGSRYYSLGYIRSRTPSLAAGSVPYFPDVQKEVAQLNRAQDRRVTPVLRPGRSPGGVEAELKVEDKLPLHASLELNNRYSAGTEPLRLAGMVRYDNLWQREHSLTLNYQTSPQDTSQVRAASLSYLFPLPGSDTLIAFFALKSRSDVATLGSVNVIGDGQIFGARAIVPLPALESFFHNLTLGIDYKRFNEAVSLTGAGTTSTPISYVPFLVSYNATAQEKSGITQFGASLNFAINGLGNDRINCFGQVVDEFECKRFKARPGYAYLKAEIQRTQTLRAGYSLWAKIEGQYAGQPLVSNEQYSAGGAESVRGYYESEQLGDNGLRGALELRTPGFLGSAAQDAWGELSALAFVEGARLRVEDPLPGQRARFELASAGMGLRLKARKGYSAALDLAWPLKDSGRTNAGDLRALFRLAYEF